MEQNLSSDDHLSLSAVFGIIRRLALLSTFTGGVCTALSAGTP